MRLPSVAFAALLLVTSPSWAADPTGEWLVAKRYAKINIVNCEGKLWGVVAWEARAGGVDSKNPDARKRGRPTLGMPILLGMARTQQNKWEGSIYNSEDGQTYSANISLLNNDTLKVQGCVMGFLCGGENWSRVAGGEPAPAATTPAPRPGANARAATPVPTPASSDVCARIASASGR